jgi:SAM-dependent methyltransferase
MKKLLKQIWISILCRTGIDLRDVITLFTFIPLRKYREFKKDLKTLKEQEKDAKVIFPFGRLYPCYPDKEGSAGSVKGAYFWQDLCVAQKIFKNNPEKHVDIGSSISGFVAHVASFREIEVFDIRPLNETIQNVRFRQYDLMNKELLHPEYTDSISSLHVVEHFGLGRYGDPICYDGYLKGFENITYLLKPNGKFYFSVPLGDQRIEFHAHRVFSLSYLLEMISKDYMINSFSYVNDEHNFFPEVEITPELLKNNCGCRFGCAIFELTKKY